ncbi:MAG: hypothetical protein RL069_1088 [Planctomycetota bacterium]
MVQANLAFNAMQCVGILGLLAALSATAHAQSQQLPSEARQSSPDPAATTALSNTAPTNTALSNTAAPSSTLPTELNEVFAQSMGTGSFPSESYVPSDMTNFGDSTRPYLGGQFSETDALSTGLNFNEFPKDFRNGLLVAKNRWAVKFGGYVKADLIHDFDPIDSRDFFEPATIPVGATDRTNTRFHARQTRLNMDARWITDTGHPLRFMVEGDFYGAGDTLRLRHAYGEYGHWIIGQTWTTFTHRAALPNTLDNVGDVASIGRRQAQIRYTQKWLEDRWSWSASIENPNVQPDEFLIENNLGVARNPLPDLVTRLRYTVDRGQFQLALLGRQLAFEPNGQPVRSGPGGGLNGTGFFDITKRCRTYGGILWGKGIGSYRDLPDYALNDLAEGKALESLAWYSGLTHQWNDRWSTNLTYSEGIVTNLPGQSPSSIAQLNYIAANLIWQPTKYTFAGAEYLWGNRENYNQDAADAHRIMVSFGFLLP